MNSMKLGEVVHIATSSSIFIEFRQKKNYDKFNGTVRPLRVGEFGLRHKTPISKELEN